MNAKLGLLLCLSLASASFLTACQTLPPPSKPPTPPDVRQCREGWGPDLNPLPAYVPGQKITDAWVKAMLSWANHSAGALETERTLRSHEHACQDEMAEKGIIR